MAIDDPYFTSLIHPLRADPVFNDLVNRTSDPFCQAKNDYCWRRSPSMHLWYLRGQAQILSLSEPQHIRTRNGLNARRFRPVIFAYLETGRPEPF